MRLRHADGSLLHLAYCSNVHPADDLDGVAAQLERYTARVREQLDVPVLGIGLWVAAPALADAAAADRLAEQLAAALARGRDAQRLPVQGVPRAGGQARRLLAALGAGRRGASTRSASRGCSRELLPDDVEDGLDLDAAARLARGLGRRRAGRRRCARSPTSPVELEELRARDRQADPARAGARARLHGRDDRAGLRRARRARARVDRRLPGRLPPRGAVRGRRPRRSRCCARRACRSSRPRSRRALRVPDPASEEGRELLARFDEPRFLHQVRECVNSHVEGTDDLPEALAGGAAGASASGACTSTCRSTPPSTRRRTSCSATLAALAGGDGAADAPLRGGDVHVERHARRAARTTKGSWPAWPASWNGRATVWSRWERRWWHDAGGHRRGGSHAARAEAHAARVEARRRRLPARAGPDRPRGHLLRPGDACSPA